MTLNATYQPKVYRAQGGASFVVAASGTEKVESSGAVEFESGGILDLQTGTVFKDSTVGAVCDRHEFVDTADWIGVTSAAGGHGSWTAPTGSDILITGFYLTVVTASTTGSAKIDVGTTSASVITASTNLLNSLTVTGTAPVGVTYTSTGAPTAIKLTAGKWITAGATGSQLDALVTRAYIKYIVV